MAVLNSFFNSGYRVVTGGDLNRMIETINTAFSQQISPAIIGQPNGLATLDGSGDVPATQIPAPATFGAVDVTTAQSIAGVKTFSSSPAIPVPSGGPDAANKNYVDAQITIVNAAKVDITTDQTIAGVKTFSSSPVLPAAAPTTANQATPKTYVDTADARTPTVSVRGGVLQQAAQANSVAADVATLVTDFNSLLVKLRTAGVLAP